MQKENLYERFQRQLILKGIGESGQQLLSKAKVLIVGAGGLGCPAMLYLAAAGVGTIGVIDDDVVELENLHRQPIYSMEDIGKSKAACATSFLNRLNPGINVIGYAQRLTNINAQEVMEEFDIIIDCSDNFSSKYMINDACVLLGKPLVFGAVSQYEGQLAIFNGCPMEPGINIHYRDLFPEPPDPGEVLSCAESGVLGVVPGIIGTMQAAETIKLITGIGQPMINRLYTFNVLNNQSYELALHKRNDSDALMPSSLEAFRQTDYVWLCEKGNNKFEINIDQLDDLLAAGKTKVIDVREPGEMPFVAEFTFINIPLSQLEQNFTDSASGSVVFFCQTGLRSAKATRWLQAKRGNSQAVFSLRGGILNYINQKKGKTYE